MKQPKLYFSDNGIANILTQLSSGAQFENCIFNQLKHHGVVQYYSLKTGREIDFILNEKIAFEVKETPTNHDLNYLRKLSLDIGIKDFRLIGRQPVPNFNDYIWGGEIR